MGRTFLLSPEGTSRVMLVFRSAVLIKQEQPVMGLGNKKNIKAVSVKSLKEERSRKCYQPGAGGM